MCLQKGSDASDSVDPAEREVGDRAHVEPGEALGWAGQLEVVQVARTRGIEVMSASLSSIGAGS